MTEPIQSTVDSKLAALAQVRATKEQMVDTASKMEAINTRTSLLNPNSSTADYAGNLALGVADRSLQLVGKVATTLPTAINEAGGGRKSFTTKEYDLHKSITRKREESAALSKRYLDPKTPALQKEYLKSRIGQLSEANYSDEEAALIKAGEVDTNVPVWEMTGTTDSRFDTIDNYLTNQSNISKHSDEYKVIEPLVNRDAVNDTTAEIAKVGNKEWDNASKGVDKVMDGDITEGLSDVGSALAEFTGSSLDSITDNPGAVVQLVTDSIPDMLLSGASMPVALAAYMTDNVKTAITDFQKASGRMPVGDELTTLYEAASASGVADLLGDKLIGVGGGARKAITRQVAKAIPTKIAKNAAVNAVAKVGGELATSAVGEGIAESSADVLQQYAVKQDVDKLDVGQSLAAGALGAAAGVATVGAIETAKLPSKALKAGTIAAVKHAEKTKAKQAEQAEADKDLNSVATDAANQMDEVLAKGKPEAGKEADFVKDINEPLQAVNKELAVYRDKLQSGEEITDDQKEELAGLMKTRTKLVEAKKTYEKVNVAPVTTVEEGKAAIADVIATPDAKKTAAVFFSAAQNPELYTDEDIASLAQNETLTTPQKAFVKGFIAYKEALAKVGTKSIDEVNTDILVGGEGFVGIKERIANVANSLASSDTTYATSQVMALEKFLGSQENKLAKGGHAPNFEATLTSEIDALKQAHTFLKGSLEDKLVSENTPTEEVAQDATTTEGTEVGSEQSVATNEGVPPLDAVPDADVVNSTTDDLAEPTEGTEEVNANSEGEELTTEQAQEVEEGITEDAAPIDGTMEEVSEPSGPEYTNPEHDNTTSALDAVAKSATDTKLDKDFEGKKAKDTPLHREPNLFSKLTDTASDTYTKLTGHLNPTQKKALTVVTRFVAANSKAILKNTKATVTRHAMNHTFNDFVTGGKDGAPEIDENVVSTIALVNHNWIVTGAGETITNHAADINGLLDRDSKHHVTDAERQLYQKAGIPLAVLVESLGSDVVKELGIKAKATSSPNAEGQLRTSLGQVAAISLVNQGILEQVWVDIKNGVVVHEAPKNAAGFARFVRAAVVEETHDFNGKLYTRDVLAKSAAYIVKSNKDSDKMLDTMFGIASEAAPIYDNAEDVPAYTVDQSGNPLAGEQIDSLTKHSKEAHSMKEAQFKVFQSLGLALQADMLGFVVDIEVTKHKDSVLGTQAANEAVLRSIEAINNLGETHEGKDFFFAHSVAKNKRMHMIKGNGISTQADKLHRHLIKMNSWVTEVDMTKPDSIGAHMFRAAVGEAFGVDVDKNDITKTQKGFEEVIARPAVIAGVAEVNKALAGEPSDSYLIREAIGKGKAFGLDGLVALAQMDTEKPFTTDLFREVDGVTNGVAIGMLQLVGAASYADAKATLARCGIALDNGETSYGAWYNDPANDDSYQDLTKEIIHYFNRVTLATKIGKQEVSHEAVNAFVTGLDGFLTNLQDKDGAVSKAGRALSKDPLMQANYGAGMQAIMASVSANIVDSVAAAIEKANSGATSEQEAAFQKIEASIGLLTTHRFKIDRSNPLQTDISEAVKKDIGFAVDASYGKAMEYAIGEKYGRFQEHAKLINNAVGVSFNAFKVMYDDMLAKIDKPTNADVQHILDVLKPYSPMVATAISNEIAEGGYAEDGVNFVNREKTKSYNGKLTDPNKLSPANQELVVKSEFVGGGKFKNKGMASSIYGRSFKEPGVSPAVLLIQSMDASTIVRLMAKHSILNVHDAAGMNMNKAPEMSKAFNKGFHDLNKNYSILSAVQDTMNRTLDGYVKLTGDTKLTRVPFDTNGDQVFIDSGISLDVNDFRKSLSQAVDIVNNNREVVFSRMTNMVQYNAELGNYSVDNGTTTKEFQTLPDAIRYERDYINEQEDAAPVVSLDDKQKSRLTNMHTFLRSKLTAAQLTTFSGAMSGSYENLIAQVSNNVAFRELLANTPAGKSNVLALFEEVIGEQPKQKAEPVKDTVELSVLKGLAFQGANAQTRTAIVKDIVSMVQAGLNIDAAFDGAKANWDSKMVASIQKRYSTKYGSSSTQTADAFADRAQGITSDNVTEIFDTLSKMDSPVEVTMEHQSRLEGVLGLAKTVMSPLKLLVKEQAGEESLGSLQGDTVFVSANTGLLTSKLEMSPQEVYVHELTHAISRYGIEKFGAVRRELKQTFAIAEKYMTAEDLMTGTTTKGTEAYDEELKAANARYDHVFDNEAQHKETINAYSGVKTIDTHDHSLDEFLALANTNQQFIDALKKADKRVPKKLLPKLKDNTLKGWAKSLLDMLIDYVSTSLTGLRGKSLDDKAKVLLTKIASAENRQKSKVYQALSRTGDKVMDTSEGALKSFANLVNKAADRPFFKQNKFSIVRNVASVASGDTDGLVKAMGEFARESGLAQKQWAISFYNEIRGASADLAKIIQLSVKGSHIIDQARTRIASHYSKYLTGMYKTKLTSEKAGAIHRTLIKTDMEGLVERFGIAESIKLMHSGANKAIDGHIKNLESQLDNGFPRYAEFYKAMSKGLGYWMATGLSVHEHQLTNAHQVAYLTGWDVVPRGNFLDSVDIIDSLASLHALKATKDADRNSAYETMQNEIDYSNINDNNNGFMATIISHREMKAASLKELFRGNPAQMVKGYAKESFNPHVDVTVADEIKGKELESLGYEKGAEVAQDAGLSTKRTAHYYVLRGGAGTKHMAGAFSTANLTAKGTDLMGINGQAGNIDPSIGAYVDQR